jgi:hypothetical protein
MENETPADATIRIGGAFATGLDSPAMSEPRYFDANAPRGRKKQALRAVMMFFCSAKDISRAIGSKTQSVGTGP